MKKFGLQLFYIGPLVLWMLVIYGGSTSAGETQNSMSLLQRALEFVAPQQLGRLSPATLNTLNVIFRKLAHVTEYAILTLLAVRAIQFGKPALKISAILSAAAIAVLFAVSDELHQRFVRGRSASHADVVIDTIGIVLVLVGLLLWFGVKALERRLWDQYQAETAENTAPHFASQEGR